MSCFKAWSFWFSWWCSRLRCSIWIAWINETRIFPRSLDNLFLVFSSPFNRTINTIPSPNTISYVVLSSTWTPMLFLLYSYNETLKSSSHSSWIFLTLKRQKKLLRPAKSRAGGRLIRYTFKAIFSARDNRVTDFLQSKSL